MADLSAFSSASYQTASWVNDALKEKPEDEPLEAWLAALAMKLHILSVDLTDQLETGMVEAMSTMPRVLAEVSRIEETLRGVDGNVNDLAAQLRTFDQRNVAGVEDLSRLDTLKSNMEKCKATLEEHARWSQLVREAKAFLEGGGRLSDSADRIATMYWSLEILKNMPGHEERRETCEKLSDLLLSALRPRVKRDILSATSNADLGPLHEYLYVYDKLGRRSELEGVYVSCRIEAKLGSTWSSYSVLSSPFPGFFASFLARVAQMLAEEGPTLAALFGLERSGELLCSTLERALDEGFARDTSLRLYESASPTAVQQALESADEFAAKALSLVTPKSTPASAPASASASTATAERVFGCVFAGFISYAAQHGAESEAQALKSRLAAAVAAVTFDSSTDAALGEGGDDELFGDAGADQDAAMACSVFAGRLVDAAEASFAPAEAALNRSAGQLGGVHVKAAVRAVAAALSGQTKALTSKVEELRVACGLQGDSSSSSSSASSSSSSSSSGAAPTSLSVAESWARRLEVDDSGGGSKALVPGALRALQAAGRMARHVRALDSVSAGLLAELAAALAALAAGGGGVAPSLDRLLSQAEGGSSSGSGGSLAACWALYQVHQDPAAVAELRSFLSSASSHLASQSALAAVFAPLAKLKASAGSLLFELCLSAPDKALRDLLQEGAWEAEGEAGESPLPQPAVTQVGEHLLSLVQELELFASSDALPDLVSLSGSGEAQTQAASSRGWGRMRGLLELRDDEGLEGLCRRPSCSAAVAVAEKLIFGSVVSPLEDLSTDAALAGAAALPALDDEAVATSFVNDWLGAVADATVGLLLAQVLQVRRFTPLGRAQLVADLDYMSNVVNAMGLRTHPLASHLRSIVADGSKGSLQGAQGLQAAVEGLPARSPVSMALQRFDAVVVRAGGV